MYCFIWVLCLDGFIISKISHLNCSALLNMLSVLGCHPQPGSLLSGMNAALISCFRLWIQTHIPWISLSGALNIFTEYQFCGTIHDYLGTLAQVSNYLDKAAYISFKNKSVLSPLAPCTSADIIAPMSCCALMGHQTESQRTDENRV